MRAALLVAFCVVVALLSGWRVIAERNDVRAAERDVERLVARAAAVSADTARERARRVEIEAETTQLLERIAALAGERRETRRMPTDAEIRERHTRAREQAERGAWAEALADYEWCYDRAFLRSAALVKNFARVAASYAPAAAALELRLPQAEARVRQSAEDSDALQDFVLLDAELNGSARSFALHDELPEEDERRRRIARALLPAFLERRRYGDVVGLVPDLDRSTDIDARLKQRDRSLPAALHEQQRIAIERSRNAQAKATIDSAAVVVEILAGVGDAARASELAAKVLLFDPAPETRAILRARGRAGALGGRGAETRGGKVGAQSREAPAIFFLVPGQVVPGWTRKTTESTWQTLPPRTKLCQKA